MVSSQAGLGGFHPRLLAAAASATIVTAWSAPAQANAGVPMLALVWPFSWLAFVPIVLIEAYVARRMFRLASEDSLRLALKANAWSTLAGIPATWFLLLLLEMLVGSQFGELLGNPNSMISWALTPFLLAWLPDARPWVLLVAAAGLCVPFYFMSVWVEGWSARRRLPKTDARRWARWANTITYGLAILVLGVAALVAAGTPTQDESAAPPSERRSHGAVQNRAKTMSPAAVTGRLQAMAALSSMCQRLRQARIVTPEDEGPRRT